MSPSMRLQLLICLIVYVTSAHGIMVKYGTRDGPILPPTPEPELPPSQPYRAPAPVWEQRSNDAPDPNANWRPPYFKPQPRYTQVVFNVQQPVPLNNAQRFVNSYIPIKQHKPVQAEPNGNYFTPAQVLSSQSLPGFGLRYFVPTFVDGVQNKVENEEHQKEDAKLNHIESNDVNGDGENQNVHDAQWKYEKESRRNVRHTQEASLPVYFWPAYIAPVHHQ